MVFVCAAFCLAVTEAKTEIKYIYFTHEGDAGDRHHIQRRGSRPGGVQPNEQVRMPPGERQPQRRPVHTQVDWRMRNIIWRSFRKYTLQLYDRPSAPLELKTRMLRAEVLETMLYDCILSRGALACATTTRCAEPLLLFIVGKPTIIAQLTRFPVYLNTYHEDGK